MNDNFDHVFPRFPRPDQALVQFKAICNKFQSVSPVNAGVQAKAATFTHVNGSVSCFCNKRLRNWPTVCTNFTT